MIFPNLRLPVKREKFNSYVSPLVLPKTLSSSNFLRRHTFIKSRIGKDDKNRKSRRKRSIDFRSGQVGADPLCRSLEMFRHSWRWRVNSLQGCVRSGQNSRTGGLSSRELPPEGSVSENTVHSLGRGTVYILYEKYETLPCPPLLKEDSRTLAVNLMPAPQPRGVRRWEEFPLGKMASMREKTHRVRHAVEPGPCLLTTGRPTSHQAPRHTQSLHWLFSVFS